MNGESVQETSRDASELRMRLFWIVLFGVAFGYVEASVVAYLREIFYPQGFGLPLVLPPKRVLLIEGGREMATLVMLVAVAAAAGRRFWERAGHLLIAFGVWDILYYVWLHVMLGWPTGLLDWDILFLLPRPWVAPVLAPVVISVLMIGIGFVLALRAGRGRTIRMPAASWALGFAATALVLYSFMHDAGAGLDAPPAGPYPYGFLIAGGLLYLLAFSIGLGASVISDSVSPAQARLRRRRWIG